MECVYSANGALRHSHNSRSLCADIAPPVVFTLSSSSSRRRVKQSLMTLNSEPMTSAPNTRSSGSRVTNTNDKASRLADISISTECLACAYPLYIYVDEAARSIESSYKQFMNDCSSAQLLFVSHSLSHSTPVNWLARRYSRPMLLYERDVNIAFPLSSAQLQFIND